MACDLNRQDWVVLLQLRDEQELQSLANPPWLAGEAGLPASDGTSPACCVECTDGDPREPCATVESPANLTPSES